MKKRNDTKVKQLRLARETLRNLTGAERAVAAEDLSLNSCQTVGLCCTEITTTFNGALSPA